MKAMMILLIAALALGLSGCVGTSALRIGSTPEGAKVYANGKYVGVTPVSVPVDWGYFVVHAYCDETRIKVEKPGFRPAEREVRQRDLGRRNRNGTYSAGSEFGSGRTYPYVFTLDPAK